jgi:hypothetical protein
MRLVHPNELFPNDLAEPLSTRCQTAKAVVNSGYRSDALSDSRVNGTHHVCSIASVDEVTHPTGQGARNESTGFTESLQQ